MGVRAALAAAREGRFVAYARRLARRGLRGIVRSKPVLAYFEMHIVDHCNVHELVGSSRKDLSEQEALAAVA